MNERERDAKRHSEKQQEQDYSYEQLRKKQQDKEKSILDKLHTIIKKKLCKKTHVTILHSFYQGGSSVGQNSERVQLASARFSLFAR